jgi:hypothetical protein
MKIVACILTFLMLAAIGPLLGTGAAATGPFSSVSVSSGSYHAIDLGTITAGKELEIDYSADDDIDVLLMTSGQYSSWQSGGTSHTNSGSDYSDSGDDYVYTIESSAQYYLVLDNSNQNPGGASATGSTVTVSGSTSVVDADPSDVRTRMWAAGNSHASVSLGTVNQGKVIGFDFSCDDSSDSIDFLLMDSLQLVAFNSGSTASWNKHAAFLDTCSDSWDYETTSTSHWYVVIENGASGEVTVDIDVDVRSLVPLVEVTDTTRMIDDGDYWKVDLGYTLAGSVFNIWVLFDSHGTGIVLDDIDILVMETSEANDFISGNSADLLGHASGLDTSGSVLGEVWDYRFPSSGTYSIVFDNSDEPSGGAGGGSDIHLELSVTELSIPNLFGNMWTGWFQSRHYVDEGDFVSFDLGTLDVGDDLYYYVGSRNVGGSIFSVQKFDALLMTQGNYDLYVNGSEPTLVSSGTKMEQTEQIPLFRNSSIASTDDYWLVFDAQDGPTNDAADEDGDWMFDFMILTDGSSITSPQVLDHHYEDPATNGGGNTPPDADGDGVSNGLDDCSDTSSGAIVDSSGCSSSQLDSDGDGVSDNVDVCPGYDDNIDSDGDGTPDGCETEPTDSDGDGVDDEDDQCPYTDAGASVDSDGCADNQKDTDGDGVTDDLDMCSNTPAGTTVGADGCELDSDGDGVGDDDDNCPNEPALSGYDNDMDGCTDDTDGDGVTDDLDVFPDEPTQWSDRDGDTWGDNPSGNRPDQCPDTPTQWVLLARDRFGCAWEEEDADSDGVMNGYDDCPDTESGRTVDADGCSDWQLDDDGDGVADSDDVCPGHDDNVDTDGDGTPDGCDSTDDTPPADSDGDGYGDDPDGPQADGCPTVWGSSTQDLYGCPDADNDTVSDYNDVCPGHDDNVDTDGDGTPDGCDSVDDNQQNQGGNDDTTTPPVTNDDDSSTSSSEAGGLPGFSLMLTLVSIVGALAVSRRKRES